MPIEFEGMNHLCRHCPGHRARNGTSRMGLVRPRKCSRPTALGAKRTFDGLAISAKRQNGPDGGIRALFVKGEQRTKKERHRARRTRRRATPCQPSATV
jgi:hypothetical protein